MQNNKKATQYAILLPLMVAVIGVIGLFMQGSSTSLTGAVVIPCSEVSTSCSGSNSIIHPVSPKGANKLASQGWHITTGVSSSPTGLCAELCRSSTGGGGGTDCSQNPYTSDCTCKSGSIKLSQACDSSCSTTVFDCCNPDRENCGFVCTFVCPR